MFSWFRRPGTACNRQRQCNMQNYTVALLRKPEHSICGISSTRIVAPVVSFPVHQTSLNAGFAISVTVVAKSYVLWDISPCSPLKADVSEADVGDMSLLNVS
jgi:hypothetical protein